jgi:hypothetical protein
MCSLTWFNMGSNVHMEDIAKGKRLAPMTPKESQKKINHSHHSPQEKSTRFNVIENQVIVSSTPNHQILADPLADLMLDYKTDARAKTPYTTLQIKKYTVM